MTTAAAISNTNNNSNNNSNMTISSLTLGEPDDKCPICLDSMPVLTFRGRERSRFCCCGNFVCPTCETEMTTTNHHNYHHQKKQMISTGPTCRTALPKTLEESYQQILSNAKKGHAWAQYAIGSRYQLGSGCQQNDTEAVKWYKLAIDQHQHSWSITQYAICLLTGTGVSSKSILQAKELLEQSATLGDGLAQFSLG